MEETSTNNNNNTNKRNRDQQESPEDPTIPPAEKRLRSDLLFEIFSDEIEAGSEECLASVMKSLEEEIALQSEAPSDSTDVLQPDLGFLLEASDDELGLPPTVNSSEKDVDDGGFGQIWGFADGFSGFCDGFECSGFDDFGVLHGEFFGYGDEVCVGSDLGEIAWRPETLPAV